MAIYVTSDQHVNHQNIIFYEKSSRPFDTVEEMNEVLIKRWNSVVRPEDTVYQLGDFFMGHAENIENILPRFNGNIKMVLGNHDNLKKQKIYAEHGIEMFDFKQLFYEDFVICMCHYPIDNEDWRNIITKFGQRKMLYLYGHVHSQAPHGLHDGCFYSVGCDVNNLTPVLLDDIIQEWKDTH